MDSLPLSRIVTGQVMHHRLQPVSHHFVYPVFYLLVDIDELDSLDSWLFKSNRRALVSFNYRDHGDGRHPRQWLTELVHTEGEAPCEGAIRVQTFPRILGYLFNPVSFWFCHDPDDRLQYIVAEVNNTFGERCCYLLRPDPATGQFRNLTRDKQMHVSPFFPVDGYYQFNFTTEAARVAARIDYYRQGQKTLKTSITGQAAPFATQRLLAALAKQPLLTLQVMARIHWQALLLWVKKVPLFSRTGCKAEESTR